MVSVDGNKWIQNPSYDLSDELYQWINGLWYLLNSDCDELLGFMVTNKYFKYMSYLKSSSVLIQEI